MSALLAVVIACVGGGFVLSGMSRWFRRQRRRLATGLVATGGLLLLIPDVLAGAATGAGEAGVVTVLLMLLWRLTVIAGMTVVGGAMVLTSDPVVTRARATRDRAVRAIPMAPWTALSLGPARHLPRDWQHLVEMDRALGRRLLSYTDVDNGSSHPILRDHQDPHTRRAVEAMLHCDTLRQSASTARDVRRTPYAAAVADFKTKLERAEAYSHKVVRDNLAHGEHATIERAQRLLAYLQEHATTPAERQAAYDRIVAELSQVDPHAGTEPRPAPGHPWLDIDQRADLR